MLGRQRRQFTPQKGLSDFGFKTGITHELNIVGTGTRKDEFTQHLLAKAVNRQNARLVKMFESTFDQRCRIMLTQTGALEKSFEFGLLVAVFEHCGRFVEKRTHALAQLGRRRIGKGHDKDSVNGHRLFNHQTQHDALKGKRFSRAGACFHEPAPA